MPNEPRREAQRRADQIRSFRQELRVLSAEGANPLSPEQEARVAAHHERVLDSLAQAFDVDRSAGAEQITRGLRLASFFGALALVAAITTLISTFWGRLGLPAQVTLLTMFPLLSLAGVQAAAERERTRYVASLFALVAVGTAWVAIVMTARLLDMPFSALLLWPLALFGLAVAMSYGFRVVLAVTLATLVIAVASAFFVSGDAPWGVVFERLEPLAGSGFVLAAMARHFAAAGEGFDVVARQTGLAIGLAALLLLASVSGQSVLAYQPATAMAIYQAVMLAVCIGIIWNRLRAGDQTGTTLVSVFLGIFLLVRYLDWFWEVLPAWAFFLVLAGAAFASIAVMKRLRARLEGA